MANEKTQNEKPESSFTKSLFFGEIREDLVFPFPFIDKDTTETLNMVREPVSKFIEGQVKPNQREWDEKGEMPRAVVTQAAELGLMGIAVPEEFGGLGFKQSAYARLMQDVAAADGSLAVTLGAHQSIGYKALLLFGTPEQKAKYLPKLASGEQIACFCLTEPGSGSDAASIKTRATLSADKKSYLINGNKLWITNGQIASIFSVFAKVEVEENGEKKDKVTCFLVEGPQPGIQSGPCEHKLGIRASWTNALHFENVTVPVENIIGGVGYGFKVAMSVLNHGRLGLAAGTVGAAKNCLKAMIEHANERVQFKKKIGEFGLIQEKIAKVAMNIYVTESMVYMTTSLIDKGYDYSLESAASKIFATEMLWEAVDENVQVWAGNGYMKEYPYERWLRDARINRIFEGTNEILRAFLALGGMQGPGAELAGLAESIKYPLKGLGLAGEYVGRRMKQNVFGANMEKVHPSLKRLAAVVEEGVIEFGSHVDTLIRRHGKNLHTKQFAQKRIADVAVHLYAMTCVLSRLTSRIESKVPEKDLEVELAIAEAFFMKAKRLIEAAFSQRDRNEDESMKFIANKFYEMGEYPYEVFTK